MSVNKYMHPRNIYRTPPNFKQMAIDYPDFRKYVKQDIAGKIRIDFKNNETLRSLTQTLLKKDFDLDVVIPLERLIPTVPLRLNYILWIEDLLSISINTIENIYGIDIGTGASCIYPLLGAKQNKWNMLATEINIESLNIARENVSRNNLQNLITLKQSNGQTLLKDILDQNITYNFCMCNPPFFSSTSELDPKSKSRSNSRPLPRNASSGLTSEVVAHGGEVEFLKDLIYESVELKSEVIIFSTMVGHKSSIGPLKTMLRSVEVVNFKQTEFHQGHTTRWGLAWTFQNIDLQKVPQNVSSAKKKSEKVHKFIIPEKFTKLNDIINKTKELFQILQFDYEEIKRNQFVTAFHARAERNTWSHQRRKRREQLRKEQNTSTENNASFVEETNDNSENNETQMDDMRLCSASTHQKRPRDEESDDDDYFNVKKLRINDSKPVFLKFTTLIRKHENEYHLEMVWIEGSVGKEAIYQIIQYFKNHFK